MALTKGAPTGKTAEGWQTQTLRTDSSESKSRYDAVIVLTHLLIPPGVPGAECINRAEKGIELYQSGEAKSIVLSGGGLRAKKEFNRSEASAVYEYARKQGVEHAWLENASMDTAQSLVFTLRDIVIPQDWQKLLVVTSDYHIARSQVIGQMVFGGNYELQYIGVPSDQYNGRTMQMERSKILSLQRSFANTTPGDPVSLVRALQLRDRPYGNLRIRPQVEYK
jgi:uncharacterized SAM-binding protein YcdF (DUF218 family)